ncbi:MAG TPA: response regulator [Chloroflexota bacterium]
MPEAVRVLLVDHNAIFRRCLVTLLSERHDVAVVGEASRADAALDLAHAVQPDVVLVDPSVPEGGPSLVAALQRAAPRAAVLVLVDEPGHGDAALGRPRGYLPKGYTVDDLVLAIKAAHASAQTPGDPRPSSERAKPLGYTPQQSPG